MTTIRVPASTSNLGPGFDSHGLALGLYLTVEVEQTTAPYGTFLFEGEGADELRTATEENIILRAMNFAAAHEEVGLQPARLRVKNEVPLARGLGSSGAAIIAGLTAFEVVTGRQLSVDKLLCYATQIEGHSDNVAAALLGSFVVSCLTDDARVLAARIKWPEEVRAVVVVPDFKVRTEQARAVVPETLPRSDAVFNIQRASLMVAAVAGHRFEFLSEATRDRLHQPYRAALAPGLEAALNLGRKGAANIPGLLGLALSGSGPTVVAFGTHNFDHIGEAVAGCFRSAGVHCTARVLSVEARGRVVG